MVPSIVIRRLFSPWMALYQELTLLPYFMLQSFRLITPHSYLLSTNHTSEQPKQHYFSQNRHKQYIDK